jgi:hypothetical protein
MTVIKKRGKYYLTYAANFYNEKNVLKTTRFISLVLPRTRDEIKEFVQGIRGLSD